MIAVPETPPACTAPKKEKAAGLEHVARDTEDLNLHEKKSECVKGGVGAAGEQATASKVRVDVREVMEKWRQARCPQNSDSKISSGNFRWSLGSVTRAREQQSTHSISSLSSLCTLLPCN